MRYALIFSICLFAVIACDKYDDAGVVYTENKESLSPDFRFGQLFIDVQTSDIFPDSKTFADAVPRYPTDQILDRYEQAKESRWFSLKRFLRQHFSFPEAEALQFEADTSMTLSGHIQRLMPLLVRKPDTSSTGGSLLPLPYPYIVPGGRFRELYYWDSYFTLLGVRALPDTALLEHMVQNFAYLIDTIGFIPNGNRTYYRSRSQPPFFALMVGLLADMKGDHIYVKYLPQMEREYNFWMEGQKRLAPQIPVHRRVVRMPDGRILNRYWDDQNNPRPESYREDIETARASGRPGPEVFRDIRAACESGWDFSSRWLTDSTALHSIRTTQFVPVDLNVLLWNLENTLAKAWTLAKRGDKSRKYTALAQTRRSVLLKYCWDKERQFFFDYRLDKRTPSRVYSLAGAFPLFLGLAAPPHAQGVAEALERDFLQPGGFVTTLNPSGQQWDAPNGWAPLQWIAVEGLKKYGYSNLADTAQQRWISLVDQTYRQTGKIIEKYNVMDLTAPAGGGEYPTQDGFGWTNGVILAWDR